MTRGEVGAWRNPLATQIFDLNSHVFSGGPDTRNRAVAQKIFI